MMHIDLQRSRAGLEGFLPIWRIFLHNHPPPTPFQTPEWLLTWWKHFGSGQLHVMVFRSGDEPVAVVPLFLHNWNGRRQVTLIGSGISDYLDPVCDPRYLFNVADALREHLMSRRDWEVCDWQDLSADTPLASVGQAVPDTPCTRVALARSFDAFLAERPHGLRRNLRRYAEKARSRGQIRFDVFAEAQPELLNVLIELHRARWQLLGEPGMIDSNRSEAFVRDVAGVMADEDRLRIFTLHCGERITAIILALRDQTSIFSYLSAFDPAFEALGCGRELLARALEYAHREGYRYWNFLRGNEPYKFEWGAQAIPKCRVTLERREPVRDVTLDRAMPAGEVEPAYGD